MSFDPDIMDDDFMRYIHERVRDIDHYYNFTDIRKEDNWDFFVDAIRELNDFVNASDEFIRRS